MPIRGNGSIVYSCETRWTTTDLIFIFLLHFSYLSHLIRMHIFRSTTSDSFLYMVASAGLSPCNAQALAAKHPRSFLCNCSRVHTCVAFEIFFDQTYHLPVCFYVCLFLTESSTAGLISYRSTATLRPCPSLPVPPNSVIIITYSIIPSFSLSSILYSTPS